jgi:hypothetical protein
MRPDSRALVRTCASAFAKHSTAQHCTAQHSIAPHRIASHRIAPARHAQRATPAVTAACASAHHPVFARAMHCAAPQL